MSLLVVLPTYNERENLERVTGTLLALDLAPHLLVVDDASPDGTGRLAEDLAARSGGRLRVLHRPGRLGLGTAYLEGFRWGLSQGYDLLAEMDSDLSHDPADLPRLVAALDSGADVALGSRYTPGGRTLHWGLFRRLLSRGGNLYARLWLGGGPRDLTGGFKVFRRRVLEAIPLAGVRSEGYAFQIEMTWRALQAGFRVAEVPIVFTERRAGRSKMSARIALEAIVRVPALRLGRAAGRGSRAVDREGAPP